MLCLMDLQAKRRERQESEAALGMGATAADATAARSSLAPLVPMHAAPQLDENGLPIQQQRMQVGGHLPEPWLP